MEVTNELLAGFEVPKDVASAQAVIASLFKELDSISHVINTQFKELVSLSLLSTIPFRLVLPHVN
jgi:hypothetical protein